ncbi:dephospho-CoA kinase [Natranaerobius thermophilus]|uniref:Dephospho-CoA kinase n=1 Tax=Natranaerobius thermophilus (strain ATCC BAA-1301 / DSM 18059 / JW/NM-WN-LF) TaxID=457570 RepID=B2A643_NATTJ|nr:dephospho-CoA kinase [Natranaerobius thermophilus]ACB85460.1 dephospho-CoA kinase [Natranaerobius thermophilus JW/NM-WN-LF]
MIVGLTGGIASGKSTVMQILSELGAATIDADKISKELTEKDSPVLDEICQAFGHEYFTEEGCLNRAKLGEKVFSDKQAKQKLEAILHPKINERLKQEISKFQAENQNKLVVVEIALLFETGQEKQYDESWVIWVDYHTQLKRLKERNGLTTQQARDRINAQMSLDKKKQLAHRVIDNSGTFEETELQVKQIYSKLL